ncbi:hypothetical protein E4T42_08453 [Aureobasidium subglaciale]|nr:hypothetical protein E4T42_08453 [Aureobasidium subglaciale]
MVKRPRLPFRIPFFRIFYSTTYTTLFLLILILLAITPTTLIYTALRASAFQYVFEVGGIYVLVAIFTLFIYSSRLYTNRSVLAAVGKSWIPVQPGEVSKKVRKEVVKAANRSALIAYETKPRNLHPDLARLKKDDNDFHHAEPTTVGKIVHVDPQHPPWGRVSHAGWSSPSQLDAHLAPHVHFRTVVMELPNLVEARAVSLAPPDPSFDPQTRDGTATPDRQVVNLLSRKPTADMRSYLAQLSGLGLIPPEAGQDFVQRYEHARFSPIPINEDDFEDLMSAFAILLANLNQLPPRLIDLAHSSSSDFTSDSSSLSSISSRSDSISSSIAGSVFRARTPGSRLPSFYTPRASLSVARTPSPTARRAVPLSTPRPLTTQTGNTIYRTPSQQTMSTMHSVRRTVPRGPHGMVDDNGSPAASLHRLESYESQQSVIRTPFRSSSGGSYYG